MCVCFRSQPRRNMYDFLIIPKYGCLKFTVYIFVSKLQCFASLWSMQLLFAFLNMFFFIEFTICCKKNRSTHNFCRSSKNAEIFEIERSRCEWGKNANFDILASRYCGIVLVRRTSLRPYENSMRCVHIASLFRLQRHFLHV